jgi:hypothetical protein
MFSPELQSQIAIWQQKCINNTITPEEMKQAIIAMRQGRVAAMNQASRSSGSRKAKGPARSADAMLGDLGL